MDMNKAFCLKVEDANPKWVVLDAEGQILGRFATKIANILRGKDKSIYTPHTLSGDYVIIINADKIVLTGDKFKNKEYAHYTGYIGGYKVITPEKMVEKHPGRLIELAVKRMLPRNKLSSVALKRLKIYTGTEHPHQAQISK